MFGQVQLCESGESGQAGGAPVKAAPGLAIILLQLCRPAGVMYDAQLTQPMQAVPVGRQAAAQELGSRGDESADRRSVS